MRKHVSHKNGVRKTTEKLLTLVQTKGDNSWGSSKQGGNRTVNYSIGKINKMQDVKALNFRQLL